MNVDIWPGAEEVAQVIVAACYEVEGDPLQIIDPRNCTRARGIAFLSLVRVRPHLDADRVGKMLGASGLKWARNWRRGGVNTKAIWFSNAIIDRVVARVYGCRDAVIAVERISPSDMGIPIAAAVIKSGLITENMAAVAEGIDTVEPMLGQVQEMHELPAAGPVIDIPTSKISAAVVLSPPELEHHLMTIGDEIANHPINTLTATNCRWPHVNSDGDVVSFCCEPQCGEAEPYCARHVGMARAGGFKKHLAKTRVAQ